MSTARPKFRANADGMTLSYFNPLVATTADLRRMLDSQQITSVQIVEQYLEQIDRYEPVLNALASIAPRDSLRRIAESLDDERRAGRVRSPLHGIPIVLKVLCPISPVTKTHPRPCANCLGISGCIYHSIRSWHADLCWSGRVCGCQGVQERRHRAKAG